MMRLLGMLTAISVLVLLGVLWLLLWCASALAQTVPGTMSSEYTVRWALFGPSGQAYYRVYIGARGTEAVDQIVSGTSVSVIIPSGQCVFVQVVDGSGSPLSMPSNEVCPSATGIPRPPQLAPGDNPL